MKSWIIFNFSCIILLWKINFHYKRVHPISLVQLFSLYILHASFSTSIIHYKRGLRSNENSGNEALTKSEFKTLFKTLAAGWKFPRKGKSGKRNFDYYFQHLLWQHCVLSCHWWEIIWFVINISLASCLLLQCFYHFVVRMVCLWLP